MENREWSLVVEASLWRIECGEATESGLLVVEASLVRRYQVGLVSRDTRGLKMTQETVIQGYKNITQVLENGEYIETLGIDMENVMANVRVDPCRTRCNDVMTTFNTLGIEAARQVLYDEICKVIEFDGSYVDYRHTAMLIDTMTYKGSLMTITRHGINRTETGVLTTKVMVCIRDTLASLK